MASVNEVTGTCHSIVMSHHVILSGKRVLSNGGANGIFLDQPFLYVYIHR